MFRRLLILVTQFPQSLFRPQSRYLVKRISSQNKSIQKSNGDVTVKKSDPEKNLEIVKNKHHESDTSTTPDDRNLSVMNDGNEVMPYETNIPEGVIELKYLRN